MAAIVVLDDAANMTFGNFRDRATAPEQRSFDDFPSFESPVLHHKTTVKERKEEDSIEKDDTGSGSEDRSHGRSGTPVIQIERSRYKWSVTWWPGCTAGIGNHTSFPDD